MELDGETAEGSISEGPTSERALNAVATARARNAVAAIYRRLTGSPQGRNPDELLNRTRWVARTRPLCRSPCASSDPFEGQLRWPPRPFRARPSTGCLTPTRWPRSPTSPAPGSSRSTDGQARLRTTERLRRAAHSWPGRCIDRLQHHRREVGDRVSLQAEVEGGIHTATQTAPAHLGAA